MIFISSVAGDSEINNEHIRNALQINKFLQTAIQIAEINSGNMLNGEENSMSHRKFWILVYEDKEMLEDI